jgi:hypothetical protein
MGLSIRRDLSRTTCIALTLFRGDSSAVPAVASLSGTRILHQSVTRLPTQFVSGVSAHRRFRPWRVLAKCRRDDGLKHRKRTKQRAAPGLVQSPRSAEASYGGDEQPVLPTLNSHVPG